MFKKVFAVIAVLMFMVGIAGIVNADEGVVDNPISISVRGNSVSNTDCGETDFGMGVALEYELPIDPLSVEIAVDKYNYYDGEVVSGTVPKLAPGLSAAVGQTETMEAINLSASLKYSFKQLVEKGVNLTPYVLGGAGIMFNDYSLFDVDATMEGHLGVGASYAITESVSVFGESRYVWNQINDSGHDMDDIDLDSLVCMVGMKYKF